MLVVNVASKCGLTPQYSALEQLAKDYGQRGLTVIGVPCNQFMGREPGTPEEIQTLCSTTYGVTFPLLAKTDVNGPDRHPLYAELTKTPDAGGEPGDVQLNFEKFLLAPGGAAVNRFRPRIVPDARGPCWCHRIRFAAIAEKTAAVTVLATVATPDVATMNTWLDN